NANIGGTVIDGFTITGGNANGETFEEGGGIKITNSSVEIRNVTIEYNLSLSGGGIYIDASNVTLTNSSIVSNSTINEGGGIFLNNSTINANNSIVLENSATNGAGVYGTGCNLDLIECEI